MCRLAAYHTSISLKHLRERNRLRSNPFEVYDKGASAKLGANCRRWIRCHFPNQLYDMYFVFSGLHKVLHEEGKVKRV